MITIFTATHRQTCTDAFELEDLAIYNAHSAAYFTWLHTQALEAGYTLSLEPGGAGQSYRADTDEEHAWFQAQAGFWEWFN